jgi:hypothetical protein
MLRQCVGIVNKMRRERDGEKDCKHIQTHTDINVTHMMYNESLYIYIYLFIYHYYCLLLFTVMPRVKLELTTI